LSGANLSGADLREADLSDARLNKAILKDANLCGALMPNRSKSRRGCPVKGEPQAVFKMNNYCNYCHAIYTEPQWINIF